MIYLTGVAMSSTLEDKKEREAKKLFQHKFDSFVKLLGPDWPTDDIRALVYSDVSHHEFENLLKNGCPKKLAIRILL